MNVCSRCGATNQPTSKFCLSCGNPLAAAAPAPQAAPPQPPAYQPPQQPPPQYAPPPQAAQPYAQPGQAPAPQGWQQPPGAYAPPPPAAPQGQPNWGPPPQPGYGQPPGPPPQQQWGAPPPDAPGFSAAPAQARLGAPEGLNPFGATMGSDAGPQAAPPQQPYGAPPPQWQPPPQQAGGWQPPPQQAQPAQPQWQPPPEHAWAQPAAQHAHDPSAFAATAPPPEEARRSQNPPPAASPAPPQASAAPALAVAPAPQAGGPGRDPELVDPGAIRTLAGFLVSYEQSELGVFWPLYQGQNHVGRKGAAPGLDVEIDHPTTSSRHALVWATARPGRLKIEDLGSTNGTFLSDQQLERGRKQELKDGDSLRFGGFTVTVKIV